MLYGLDVISDLHVDMRNYRTLVEHDFARNSCGSPAGRFAFVAAGESTCVVRGFGEHVLVLGRHALEVLLRPIYEAPSSESSGGFASGR